MGRLAESQLFEIQHLGIGDTVSDFEGVDVDGNPIKFSNFKGKIVVLNFWGSWCGPCLRKLPMLQSVFDEFPDDLVVLGVMSDEPEAAKEVLLKYDVGWPNILEGDEGPIQTRWNIDSWPTTYIIGRDGKIVARNMRPGIIEKKIREALRDSN